MSKDEEKTSLTPPNRSKYREGEFSVTRFDLPIVDQFRRTRAKIESIRKT